MHPVLIRDFQPADAALFEACNRWWVEQYFRVEPVDEAYFRDPQGKVIDKGGRIFIAEINGQGVGAVALVSHPEGMELAKMGVLPDQHGKGIAKALMQAALEAAKDQTVIIYSNRILAPALALYAAHGFIETPLSEAEYKLYERVDIKMTRAASAEQAA